jgi:hypothetical protein
VLQLSAQPRLPKAHQIPATMMCAVLASTPMDPMANGEHYSDVEMLSVTDVDEFMPASEDYIGSMSPSKFRYVCPFVWNHFGQFVLDF